MSFQDAYSQAYQATRQGALANQQAQTNQAISGALATGDYDGAAQAAYSAGNYQLGSQLTQQGQAAKQKVALGALGSSLFTAGASPSAPSPAAVPQAGALSPPQPAQATGASTAQSSGPVSPDQSVTVTGQPAQANLYDLTRAPQHLMSPDTAKAAQSAVAAGVDPSQVMQLVSLGHQIASSNDADALDRIDTVTKIAQQALNIDAPTTKDAQGQDVQPTEAQTVAYRQNWIANQIAAQVPNKQAASQLVQAASGFVPTDDNLQAFVNRHMATADVVKNSRQDAEDAQKQENFETTNATTERGQDLTHSAAMANVGVQKGRLGEEEARDQWRHDAGGDGPLLVLGGSLPSTFTKDKPQGVK